MTTQPLSLPKVTKIIAVIPERDRLIQAVDRLHEREMVTEQISVLGRAIDQRHEASEVIPGVQEKHLNEFLTDTGIGAGIGLLAGLASLAIPAFGPILAAGPLATTLAAALGGTAIGGMAGGLVGVLRDEGLPDERSRYYTEQFKSGKYLLVIDIWDQSLEEVKADLHALGIEEVEGF